MSANMYDRGVPVPIMDTYVPIDFRNLYLIGVAQNKAVQEAADKFNAELQKFGEFQSPSMVDTKRYYDLTIGRKDFQDAINQMAYNPDYFKDAANRANLQALINSVDYATLSNLKSSRDAMLQRQALDQKLVLENRYNPMWHYVDYANYDTVGSNKIFNDTNPLPYMSVRELVEPYVNNLKGEFLGKKDGFLWNGVNDQMTDEQLDKNMSSIQATPQYAKYMEIYQRMGMTPEQANAQLQKEIFTAGHEFTWNKAERDQLDLAYIRHSGSGSNNTPYLVQNLTDQLEMARDEAFTSAFHDTPTLEAARAKLKDIFDKSRDVNHSLNAAINDALQPLTRSIGEEANTILTSKATQTGKMTAQGWRVGNSSSDFMLKTRLAENVLNFKFSKDNNKLADDFEKGVFKNFLVAGTPSITADYDLIYHNKYVFIPMREIKGKYSADEIARIQGDIVNLNNDQVRITERTNDYGETSTSINTNLKEGDYLRIPVSTIVPTMGQEAVENDARHAKTRNLGQDMRDQMQLFSEMKRLYNRQ